MLCVLDAASFFGASVVVPSYTSTVNSALNVERVLSSCKKISSFPEAHSAASSANGDQVFSTTQSAYNATEYDPQPVGAVTAPGPNEAG